MECMWVYPSAEIQSRRQPHSDERRSITSGHQPAQHPEDRWHRRPGRRCVDKNTDSEGLSIPKTEDAVNYSPLTATCFTRMSRQPVEDRTSWTETDARTMVRL